MKRTMAVLAICVIWLAGCSHATDSFQGQIADIQANRMIVDCSYEVNKGKKGVVNTLGYGCSVDITAETVFRDGNGDTLTVADYPFGAEVNVILTKPVDIRKHAESGKPSHLSAKEIVLVKQPEFLPAEPFVDFNSDELRKVTVYLGGTDEVVAVLEVTEDLEEFYGILVNAASFFGDATADLNYILVMELQNGSERTIEVTGGGNVLIDQTSKRAIYLMNKDEFDRLIAEHKPAMEQ